MNIKINCMYNDSGCWCKNKKIKRGLFGFIGARCCTEPPFGSGCDLKEPLPKPPPPPVPPPKRIIRENVSITIKKDTKTNYVYMILTEGDGWGVWTDPKDAIKWFFAGCIDQGGLIKFVDEKYQYSRFYYETYTIDEMVKDMVDPDSDYPVLCKIEVNPNGHPWTMDR